MAVIPNQTLIDEAAGVLQAAAPGATVILFGSYARGDFTEESDVDFLVVEQNPPVYREEAVRLRAALRPLRIPVDVLVTDEDTFATRADTPGTVYYDVRHAGRVYGT